MMIPLLLAAGGRRTHGELLLLAAAAGEAPITEWIEAGKKEDD